MAKKKSRNQARKRRHLSIRRKISGTNEIPRLNVFRSNKHIFAALIDDETGTTLAASSSVSLKLKNGGNKEAATKVGEDIAKKANKIKIEKVVFDRAGYRYHGRVEALASAARENGLEF